MVFWQCAFGLSPRRLPKSRSQTGQTPRPHQQRRDKQNSMGKRSLGAPHLWKPSRLRHHFNYRVLRGHRDNSIQWVGPPYRIRGKYRHISILFLGKQAHYVHRAQRAQVWWRTWVVHILRVDTVIILLHVTNITSNTRLKNRC